MKENLRKCEKFKVFYFQSVGKNKIYIDSGLFFSPFTAMYSKRYVGKRWRIQDGVWRR